MIKAIKDFDPSYDYSKDLSDDDIKVEDVLEA